MAFDGGASAAVKANALGIRIPRLGLHFMDKEHLLFCLSSFNLAGIRLCNWRFEDDSAAAEREDEK